MKIQEFWEDIEIPYRKFSRGWNQIYFKKLKGFLKKKDDDILKLLCGVFDIELPARNPIDKDELIPLLTAHQDAISIWCVQQFYDKQVNVVKEHLHSFGRTETPERFVNSDFVHLCYLYLNRKDVFYQIYIKYYWTKLKEHHITLSYLPISVNHADLISQKRISICNYLKKKDQPHHYSQKIIGPIEEEGKAYFLYESQTNYNQKKDIDRSRVSKPFAKFPFCLDYANKSIEVHCQSGFSSQNKTKIKRLINRIQYHTKLVFYEPEELVKTDFNFESIAESLNKRQEDLSQEQLETLKVVGIEFSRTDGLTENYPLSLPKNRKSKDIRPVIHDLMGREIINQDNLKDNIHKITIQFSKLRPRDITVERDDLSVLYNLDKSYLTLERAEEIIFACERLLKIPLDQKIDISNRPMNKEKLISSLLNEQQLKPNKTQLEEMRVLESEGLILTMELSNKMCNGCWHQFNSTDSQCPNCGSSRIIPIHRGDVEIKVPKDKIVEYIIKLLGEESIKVTNKCAVRTLIGKHQFIEVETNHKKAFIYLIFSPIPIRLVNYFERSAMPILFVHVNYEHSRELLELKPHYVHRNLSFIICQKQNGKLPPDYFTTILSNAVAESEAVINSQAASSARNMDDFYKGESNMDEISLEDDAHNVLKFIIRSLEKWGRLMRTKEEKRLPEGIGGIRFEKSDKEFEGALIYDCKFTTKEKGYNLNMNEKRKAADYIKIVKKIGALKSFGNKLNSYIIVSNKIRQRQFKNFTETVKNDAKWNGNMILVTPQNLVKLYLKIDENFDKILRDYGRFQEVLYSLFFRKRQTKSKREYIELRDSDIESTFSYLSSGDLKYSTIPSKKVEKQTIQINHNIQKP